MASSEAGDNGEQSADSSPALGVRLREAREAMDLSIDAVAAELRIGAHFLSALEDGRYSDLGARVFAKGYLKQYASRLGLDVEELVREFDATVGEPEIAIEPSRSIKLRDERQITFWVAAGIAIVAITSTLSIWWYLGLDEPLQSVSATTSVPVGSFDADSAAGVADPATPPDTVADSGLQDRGDALPGSEGPGDAPAVDIAAEDLAEPLRAPAEASSAEGESGGSEEQVAATVAPPYSGPQLEIIFHEDSWAEISDASGEQLFFDLGDAGTSAFIPADRELRLFLGNAPGVELVFQGENVPVPPASIRSDDVAQFTLNLADPQAQ